ncbi:helix-turn-helix domain-containing protein [Halostella litorea]|uniref:helix-turn-helix domain-containing protein n=1 Tax=Halostella litorea TaxID=2528831 RepID=UPI001091C579|nr:helix-turn-helix domain-containing protein [Halostella litorea]
MNYVDVRLRQPDGMLHPMQAFIREGEAVEREELRAWNVLPERDVEYALFYVEGDRERYEAAMDGVDSVRWYDCTAVDPDSFHVYVCQETREADRDWRSAFAALDLVVVPPIVYDDEAAMRMVVVGASEDVRAMLDGLPPGIDVRVNGIGEFDRREPTLAGALTDRQSEAVRVAADLGYYEVPRSASLADVAAELGCAESTASNHLRKAEAAVMTRVAGR